MANHHDHEHPGPVDDDAQVIPFKRTPDTPIRLDTADRLLADRWVRLPADYWLDIRILTVGPAAELLYVHSLAYAELLDGGQVPWEALRALAAKADDPSAAARQLVAAGLWAPTATGWRVNRLRREGES